MLYSLAVNIFLISWIAGVATYRMIIYYPEGNHLSYDIRWGYLFTLAGLVLAIIGTCRRKKIFLPVMLIITSLVLFGLIFLSDYYNILLEYEVWIHRGMPVPFGQ